MLPAVNALIRNRLGANIGSRTRFSIATNAARSATPPASRASTTGFPQPIEWCW